MFKSRMAKAETNYSTPYKLKAETNYDETLASSSKSPG